MKIINILFVFIINIIINENILGVDSFNLTLIHNNDIHSHFAPINEWSSPCDQNSLKAGKCFGGVARIVAKVSDYSLLFCAKQFSYQLLCH